MERRLSAILAIDVVGYSRLVEADETGTFERLRNYRHELVQPEIEKHHGRIFKLMGDGLLAEFASVVDAVECAVVLQRQMAERNHGVVDGRRIDVRMGINLGDVIVEEEDRHGESVVIAARLQQLADPCRASPSPALSPTMCATRSRCGSNPWAASTSRTSSSRSWSTAFAWMRPPRRPARSPDDGGMHVEVSGRIAYDRN